jgi:hypothetical protein
MAVGWNASLLTFMFERLRGGRQGIIAQMRSDVDLFYRTFLTRVVANPRARALDRLPLLIACADVPGSGHKALALEDALVNDGLHFHGLLVVPPCSRLRVPAHEHVRERQATYVHDGTRLRRVHAIPIEATPDRAADYVMKAFRSGRLSYDDAVLVLPRSSSELTAA